MQLKTGGKEEDKRNYKWQIDKEINSLTIKMQLKL